MPLFRFLKYKYLFRVAEEGGSLLQPGLEQFWPFLAGVELLMKHPPPPFLVTRTGGIYGQMMAEYVIAQIINRERHLFGMYEHQKKAVW